MTLKLHLFHHFRVAFSVSTREKVTGGKCWCTHPVAEWKAGPGKMMVLLSPGTLCLLPFLGEQPLLFLQCLSGTPHFIFRFRIPFSLHARASSKQAQSWHPLSRVGGPCSCGRRPSLVEFEGTAVAAANMPQWVCIMLCASPTRFRSRLSVCNLSCENPLFLIPELLGKVEGRTVHSQTVMTI